MPKRPRVDQYICDIVEDGDVDSAKLLLSKYPHSLSKVKTNDGSNLLMIATTPDMADYLIDEGINPEDPTGYILSSCYSSVAKHLINKNINVNPAISFIENIKHNLSPTTKRATELRLKEIKTWKKESIDYITNILINDIHIIKDLSLLIVKWL
jgi:hypothetical protein